MVRESDVRGDYGEDLLHRLVDVLHIRAILVRKVIA